MNIRRPLGLRPKLVTSVSEAALAVRGAAKVSQRTAIRRLARIRRIDIRAIVFGILADSLPWLRLGYRVIERLETLLF
jgi:hypothetical protein